MERLALSIFAKHPDPAAPKMAEALAAFGRCERELRQVMRHMPPSDPCESSSDCIPGFYCHPVEKICKAEPPIPNGEATD
jgi:hypothetical protein